MRRIALVLAAALAATLALPAVSAAGGGATFEFRRPFLVSGETAVASTVFWRGGESVDRPMHAYLLPEGKWIDPPDIPSEAIHLGIVEIEGSRATLRFTVPTAPAGHYSIGLCDDPCRRSGIGDLIGGWTLVVPDEHHGRLWLALRKAGARADRDEWRLRKHIRATAREAEAETRELRGTVNELEETIGKLRAEVVGLRRAGEAPDGRVPVPVAALGWALALALAVTVLVRRRPAATPVAAPPVPDTVPMELEETRPLVGARD